MKNKKDVLINVILVGAIGFLCFALAAFVATKIFFPRNVDIAKASIQSQNLSSRPQTQKNKPAKITPPIVKVVPQSNKTKSVESIPKQLPPHVSVTPLAPSPESNSTSLPPQTPNYKSIQKIIFDIAAQTFVCLENGQLVRTGPMSSGMPIDETGKARDAYDLSYVIAGKKIDAYSEAYQTPMPYSLVLGNVAGNRLGREGIFIHYGILPGYPSSHGCFHLGFEDAKWVFDWAKIGTKVSVINAKRS